MISDNASGPTIWQLTLAKFWGYLSWVVTALVGGAVWFIAVSIAHTRTQAPASREISTAAFTLLAWFAARFTHLLLVHHLIPLLRRATAQLFREHRHA